MLPRVIKKKHMGDLLGFLAAEGEVVGPKKKEIQYVFGPISSLDELELDYPTSILPPKKYFLPQWETLIKKRLKGEQAVVEPCVEAYPRVLLGVHPCDIHAIALLDTIMQSGNPDPNYLEKRKRTTIIGVNCLKPCDEYSFCADMETVDVEEGYDLFLTDLGDRYLVEIGTARGKDIADRSSLLPQATQEDFAEKTKTDERKHASFHKKLSFDVKYLPDMLDRSWNSLLWEATARRCLRCGRCNLVCSTCYCFDVKDDVALNLVEGDRKRVWDACMLDEFAAVAGGENFRPQQSQRLRHRMYRKGNYIQALFGKRGCVGCGRCDRTCPVKINSVEVYNQIAGGLE